MEKLQRQNEGTLVEICSKFSEFIKNKSFAVNLAASYTLLANLYKQLPIPGLKFKDPDLTLPLIGYLAQAIGFKHSEKRLRDAHIQIKDIEFLTNGKPQLGIKDEFNIDIEFVLINTRYYEMFPKFTYDNLKVHYALTRDNILWYVVPHGCELAAKYIFCAYFEWLYEKRYTQRLYLPIFVRQLSHFVYVDPITNDAVDIFRYIYPY